MPYPNEEKVIHLVEMKGITKSFDGFRANDSIDFEVRQGDIHSLLGENGAGKTTLMKILYGLLRPDSGEIFIKGEKTNIASPRDAISLGIGMVHQHFMLIQQHTVLENIILGISAFSQPTNEKARERDIGFQIIPRLKGILDLHRKEHVEKITEIANKYGLQINLQAKIWQLSVGERQRVEIIKALYRGARLLILDEPSSNLTPKENENLFLILRSMAASGISVVLITHNLHESIMISNRITVLRGGKKIGTLTKEQFNDNVLAKMVVGREISYARVEPLSHSGKGILRLENIFAKNDLGAVAVKGISLTATAGEILGIAGVEGNGQRELIEVIMGLRNADQGSIWINGKDATRLSTREILSSGLAYIPQDRIGEGLVADFNIWENILLDRYSEPRFSDKFLIREREAVENTESLINEYDIRCPGPKSKARTLSGGNAQRVIIARELSKNPAVIIANQPTRGLDIASTEFVLNRLLDHRKRGCAILFSSTELDQLLRVSDRIAVIYGGRIQGVVRPKEADLQKIGLLMLGKNS